MHAIMNDTLPQAFRLSAMRAKDGALDNWHVGPERGGSWYVKGSELSMPGELVVPPA